jgi:hypothetical protein
VVSLGAAFSMRRCVSAFCAGPDEVHRDVGVEHDHSGVLAGLPGSISPSISSMSAVGNLCPAATLMARTFSWMSPRDSRRRASRSARVTHSDTGVPCAMNESARSFAPGSSPGSIPRSSMKRAPSWSTAQSSRVIAAGRSSEIDTAVSLQTNRPRVSFEENSGLASVVPVDAIRAAIQEHEAALASPAPALEEPTLEADSAGGDADEEDGTSPRPASLTWVDPSTDGA